ncbi:4998_t:CDS:2 [Funneliformis geosporum]|uniref:4998_t:CDS:1 n=1 Tax=Funneliformis geosporum TaxID=1117311 RepID=A0A9W4WT62_9GLOM|nr:4998_t:CDS:2 [Funneliformis geosporum]
MDLIYCFAVLLRQPFPQMLNGLLNADAIHRDLHSGNILYRKDTNEWFIGDLRFCGPIDKPLKSVYGNFPYIAPEVMFGKESTKASDIYSIGMLMWEISSGQPPFAYFDHNYDLVMNIVNGMRPNIVSGTPIEYKELMIQFYSDKSLNSEEINRQQSDFTLFLLTK